MARELITPESLSSAGIEPTFTAAVADGHKIPNNGKLILYVKNTNAASRTITVQTPGEIDGDLTIEEREVVVAATSERVIGPFDQGVYNMGSEAAAESERNMIYVDYSVTTDVTISPLKIA